MPKLSIIDYGFLLAESEASPRHIAGLQIFSPPPGAPKNFVRRLAEADKDAVPAPPYGWKLQRSMLGYPSWVDDPEFDIGDHIFCERLPAPGSREDLYERVAKLHEPVLDRDKPLWEVHFFEGLNDGCFAVYTKTHHAYMDGMSLTRQALRSLATSPDDMTIPFLWANEAAAADHDEIRKGIVDTLTGTARTAGRLALIVPQLTELLIKHSLRLISGDGGDLPVPFSAPRTLFNERLTPERSLGLCSLSLSRVRDLGYREHVTVNDVLLAICDMAMRQYLDDHHEPLERPLVAQMPISLRRGDEEGGSGNQLTIALLELASDEADPLERLQEVHRHARNVKYEYLSMSAEATEAYSLLTQITAQLTDLTHVSDKLPPLGNVLVSNVIGHRKPLYLKGARLLEIYPISTIPPNTAINITVYTHEGQMRVGLVAGKAAIPDAQLIADYIESALDTLEQASLAAGEGSGKPPATSTPRIGKKSNAGQRGRKRAGRKKKKGKKQKLSGAEPRKKAKKKAKKKAGKKKPQKKPRQKKKSKRKARKQS